MKLESWINNKIVELKQDKKYREASFDVAKPVRLARNTYCLELFSSAVVPLDAQVKEIDDGSLPNTGKSEEYLPGVMVWFKVLQPRKRKTSKEYYNLLLV